MTSTPIAVLDEVEENDPEQQGVAARTDSAILIFIS
jgi:hypothetical protein